LKRLRSKKGVQVTKTGTSVDCTEKGVTNSARGFLTRALSATKENVREPEVWSGKVIEGREEKRVVRKWGKERGQTQEFHSISGGEGR